MCFETLAIAGQCDVDEILVISQVFKCRSNAALVIIPSQAEVLRIYHRYVYSPENKQTTKFIIFAYFIPGKKI